MTAPKAPRRSPPRTRPAPSQPRNDCRSPATPGRDDAEAGSRSAPGLTCGGPTGPPIPTAAPTPWSWPTAASETTCARFLSTGPSTESARPTSAAGRPNWPPPPATPPCSNAARCCCASSRRRALTPEEAGQLLARFPLFWWDHVLTLLGTGLRFGELAGLRRRRVRLDRTPPVVQVVDIRYQAGRFGSGFKPRPKSDAGIREIPLAPEVVAAIRRQLPPGTDPEELVFTGPGGGVVARGTRTVLSRHNFRRTYHSALTKLADPATQLRPTAARVLKTLRTDGPQTANELVSALARQGRAIRPATVETALDELAASGLAAPDGTGPARRWSTLAPSGDPLLDKVDLRGAHDLRHSFATWLEDAGIPARVIDELMGHEASTRGAQHLGSTMGAHYRHTTPEMATRVVMAIQDRLVVVVSVAEQVVEAQPTRVPRNVF
jgi:integrase